MESERYLLVLWKLEGGLNSLEVISYIASYYRKYKIWLRRTRHNKRNYEVIIAIDDSSSMSENNSGSVTIEALVTICITISTSAGLEQILPWISYHKVIGVSNFFLFVEGKAVTLVNLLVLKSFPGSKTPNVKLIHRTKELEEQQAKRLVYVSLVYGTNDRVESPAYTKCEPEMRLKHSKLS
ncbi:hypothetical protein Tco_0631433 [Tanacetum coccineum]